MMASSNKANGVRGVISTSPACVVHFQIPSKELVVTESFTSSNISTCSLQMKLRLDPVPDAPRLCSGDWIFQIKLRMWRHMQTKTMAFDGSTAVVPPEGFIATGADVVHFSAMGQHFSAKGNAGRDELASWISRAGEIRKGFVAVDEYAIAQIRNARTAWSYIIAPNETLDVELAFATVTTIDESSLPVQLWDGQPANRNTDCVLISRDGKRFPCYRSILAARSTVFAAMFQPDTKQNGIVDCNLDDIDGNVLEILLEFLYTNRADAERVAEIAEEVYNAADKFAVAELCTACENIMVDNLSVKSALSCLNFAVPRGLRSLTTRTVQFMSGNIEEMHFSGLTFPGQVLRENAVSVRGSDGLSHFAWLIRKEDNGFIVDFISGPDRMLIVPFGAVFRLTRVFVVLEIGTSDEERTTCTINTVVRENDHVEVLLQRKFNEPWKWYPGMLLAADFLNGWFGHVSVLLPSDRTAVIIVPGQQIRLPSDELEHSRLHSTDVVNMVVHYPLPLDFCINYLPATILAEVFDCLPTFPQTMMRRVCSLWDNIILATPRPVVNLLGQMTNPCAYLHSLWNRQTRILVVEVIILALGLDPVWTLVKLIKRIQDEYGYPPLLAVGLRQQSIRTRDSRLLSGELSNLRDTLGAFASVCRFIRLPGLTLECDRADYSTPDYQAVSRNMWIDVSETGFTERLARSFSVHCNSFRIPDVWIPAMDAPAQKRSIMALRDPGIDSHVNIKYSGIPVPSFDSRFVGRTGKSVSIRGDDGLMQHARVVAKENNGLFVDFCTTKPFVFVPFGNIYHDPYASKIKLEKEPVPNKPVEVLLRLDADGPWKWYPATVCAVTGETATDLRVGFVRAYTPNGTTVTTIIPLLHLRFACDKAHLKEHLVVNGDDVYPDVHRQLPWELKITTLPQIELGEVLGCLGVSTCHYVRSVCKLWDQMAGAAAVSIIRLSSDVHYSVTCLSRVWSKSVTMIVIDEMAEDFPSVCHLLSRFILQNGCAPLKVLMIRGSNSLSVRYTIGSGFSDELSFLSSVCQRLILRGVQTEFRIDLDGHTHEHCVHIPTGLIDLSTANFRAQLIRMIADNVTKYEKDLEKIRSYFAQPTRSSDCVDCLMQILNDVDDVMLGDADDRRKQCSIKYLLTLQPEKLSGLSVAAVAHVLKKYCE